MKIIEENIGTPAAPVMTRNFILFPGYSTPGVVDPKIILEPGVVVEELQTDAQHEVTVGPDGRTVIDIKGTFPAGPAEPGGVLFQRYGDGTPILQIRLGGRLDQYTYDGRVTGTAVPGSRFKLGSLYFGNTTVR